MLKILADSRSNMFGRRRPRCRVYPGQRVSRKYRRAVVRRAEYRRLQKLIPNIARRRKVPELTVILEAVKYIDVLHSAIADRVRTIRGLQSVGADRKNTTPEGRDVTNDTTQQVAFLSNRIYQQTTGGATTFGRLYPPYPSSYATLGEASTSATARGRQRCRSETGSRLETGSCPSKGAAMAARESSSYQMVTTKRHLKTSDFFKLDTNKNVAHHKR